MYLWMKMAIGVSALVTVAACGTVKPTPVSDALPDPIIPPPPEPRNETLTDLQVTEQFTAVSVTFSYDFGFHNIANPPSSGLDGMEGLGEVEVVYWAGNDGFEIIANIDPDAHPDETFKGQEYYPGDINLGESNALVTVYEKEGGAYRLSLVNPGVGVDQLQYTTMGQWIDETEREPQGPTDHLEGYVVFGVRTPREDMPLGGGANYRGEVIGSMVDVNGWIYELNGSGYVGVDFTEGTVEGTFHDMLKTNNWTEEETDWRDFTTSGTIAGNIFSGSAITDDGLLSGSHSGGFFGPEVEEIGLGWVLSNEGESAVGAFIGK
jgi:hypothetical protein